MKLIAIVRHFDYNQLSALPRAAYEISRRFTPKNEVLIVTDGFKEERYDADGMRIRHIKAKNSLDFFNSVRGVISEENPSIIHFFGSLSGAILLSSKLRHYRVPIVMNLYNGKIRLKEFSSLRFGDVLKQPTRIFILSMKNILIPRMIIKRFLDKENIRIIVPSKNLKEDYGHIVKNRVIQIPHGVDIDDRKKEVSRSKETLGLNKNDKIVLYFGNSYILRGIDDLIKSLERLDDNTRLLLVLTPSSNLKYIKNLIRFSPKNKNILLKEGYFKNKKDFLDIADIVALPYRFSGEIPEYPFVLLESMASSKPVITTNIGSIPEIIQNDYNGLVINAKKPEELRNAIMKFLDDGDFAKKCGINARKTVESFDWDIVSQKVFKVYKEAI